MVVAVCLPRPEQLRRSQQAPGGQDQPAGAGQRSSVEARAHQAGPQAQGAPRCSCRRAGGAGQGGARAQEPPCPVLLPQGAHAGRLWTLAQTLGCTSDQPGWLDRLTACHVNRWRSASTIARQRWSCQRTAWAPCFAWATGWCAAAAAAASGMNSITWLAAHHVHGAGKGHAWRLPGHLVLRGEHLAPGRDGALPPGLVYTPGGVAGPGMCHFKHWLLPAGSCSGMSGLQVGYDAHSYGYRDLEGSKVQSDDSRVSLWPKRSGTDRTAVCCRCTELCGKPTASRTRRGT